MKELKQFERDLRRIINYFDQAYYFIFSDARLKNENENLQKIRNNLKILKDKIERIIEKIKDQE